MEIGLIGTTITILTGLAAAITTLLITWYRIVPPSEAHYVVSPNNTMVISSDTEISNKRWYFEIPIIRTVRKLDLTIKELVVEQETYEKNQARYNVRSSTKYRIINIKKAAETFTSNEDLKCQLGEVIQAAVRAVTVNYDVTEARAKKSLMSNAIDKEITDDLQQWGLKLISFQLVDFQNTKESNIISDISRRREVEIQSITREENAEKIKQARIKEAESEEQARQREIQKEETIAKREQDKNKEVYEREKIAQKEAYEVTRVQIIEQEKINKEQAKIEAEKEKEVALIQKEKKKLEGEGNRLRAEEQAKGEAAPIREMGIAHAEAREKLQEALNKFSPDAIRALIAESLVQMQEKVGIETAKALKEAEIKVFAGGGKNAETGFDFGKMITSLTVSNESLAESVLNRLSRPNDLGFSEFKLKKEDEEKQ